jgi:(p)ppGpp synthase/HD superfamily hydrolase
MYNQDTITKAWFFASVAHKTQLYPTQNLPYITHIGNVMMEVMGVVSALKNPELSIVCSILHDTIEDTQVSYDELVTTFGEEVANGVLALTKNEKLPTKKERMLDSLERIKEQSQDVWLVKMADRIANLGKPPLHWKKEKIEAYRDEAKLILEHLKQSNELLAQRLAKKIEEYQVYVV